MALRTKTLWFVTEKSDADIADATLTALPQITVYAENSTRTFKSVQVWVAFTDMSTATGATIGEHRVACSVNGAAATTITEVDDIANSGENIGGWLGPFGFLAHFVANFPAANSATLDLSVYFDVTTGTGLTVNNITALIAITYEFDDSAATQYATAIIPLESLTGALGTTEAEIGTNQIPQLTGSGGLLENVSTVTMLQQFFIIEGNAEAGASTTNFTVNTRIDTGTTKTFRTTVQSLGSDRYCVYTHIESPSTSAVHAWKAWSTGAGRMNHCCHTMYITYSFAVSGTTEWLNSIQIPFRMNPPMGGATSADSSRAQHKFFIEEPTTTTLKQSGFRLCFIAGGSAIGGLNVRAGGQTYRAYTNGVSMVCGSSALQQRIDSGSAQGAGVTLARGENTVTVDAYRTDTTDLGWTLGGIIFLNYKSGVSGSGIWANNHTTIWTLYDWDAAIQSVRETVSTAIPFSETNRYINAFGCYFVTWQGDQYSAHHLIAEVLSGEGKGDGWRWLASSDFTKDGERSYIAVFSGAADSLETFTTHPDDPDLTKLVIGTARKYRYVTSGVSSGGSAIVTHHSITFSKVTAVTGSAGGTVYLVLFRADTGKPVLKANRVGNGNVTWTWYDDQVDMYVEAYESDTYVGRSGNFKFSD